MGEVIEFPKKHVTVRCESSVNVISLDDIRSLAYGFSSIAEFQEPEKLAQALAVIALEYLNDR